MIDATPTAPQPLNSTPSFSLRCELAAYLGLALYAPVLWLLAAYVAVLGSSTVPLRAGLVWWAGGPVWSIVFAAMTLLSAALAPMALFVAQRSSDKYARALGVAIAVGFSIWNAVMVGRALDLPEATGVALETADLAWKWSVVVVLPELLRVASSSSVASLTIALLLSASTTLMPSVAVMAWTELLRVREKLAKVNLAHKIASLRPLPWVADPPQEQRRHRGSSRAAAFKQTVERFFTTGCIRDPAATLTATEAHAAYRAWAASSGALDIPNVKQFGRFVSAVPGLSRSRSGGAVLYSGFRPRSRA